MQRWRNETSYLVKVGAGFTFTDAVEVLHVDQLEVVAEAGVGHPVLGHVEDVAQVSQQLVAPVVQVADTGTNINKELYDISTITT